jgi:putative ABC transport system permease protein
VSGRRASAVVLLGMRYLGNRPLATVVSIAAISIALMLVVGISLVNFAVKRSAVEGALRYPLIVGPEGSSSVQLIFSTVFHVDKPTGTIPFEVYERLRDDRRVIAAYPIAMADSLESYPVVGIAPEMLTDGGARLAAGAIDLARNGNAVLGSEVAARTGLGLGDMFHGSHGMLASEGAHVHAAHPYRVVGVLLPSGGPDDAAVYTSYKAVWAVHAGGDEDAQDHDGAAHGEDKYHLGEGRLTAVLVRTANPVYAAMLERELTLSSGTQAVDTGRAIRRFIGYLDKGERLVEAFGMVTLAVAVSMILVTLIMSLSERRRELALLRSLGIGRLTISAVAMVEGLVITLGGALVGAGMGHVAVWWAAGPIRGALGVTVEPWVLTSMEAAAVLAALVAGQLLAAVGMIWTYRMNLVETVARD